ncbi:MAG: ABC transporter permease subunit [Rubrobacter sp.]|nr:ABC transporter permease subunit [Rubrobacter sp.]
MLAQSELIPRIPLGEAVERFFDFLTGEALSGFFNFLEGAISTFVAGFESVLTALPSLVMIALFAAVAWYLAGWGVGLFTALGFLLILSMEMWDPAMLTLALVLASVIVAIIVGVPLGILAAQSRTFEAIARPVLDFMQTMPPFVYLIPGVFLFGLGVVPALVVTVIFATPPAIRLTLLGIQQVSKETVEAAHAFGATRWQTLIKVELPQALLTIMAGVNQVIMLALSMVVIAALIGAGGLGGIVVQGLSRLDIGLGAEGGVAIVIIAIVLDRITRNIGQGSRKKGGGAKAKA